MNTQKFIFIFRVIGGAILRFLRFTRAFGLPIAYKLFRNDLQRLTVNNKMLRYKVLAKRHNIIEDYLRRKGYNGRGIIETKINKTEGEKLPIWICWWQGEQNLPPIVKCCIESIKLHSNSHPVKFITFENYEQFVDIDKRIVKKVKKGKFKLAHFADLVRVKLLAKYGGLWLDSTVYLTADIDDFYFQKYFSVKSLPIDNDSVSEYRWATFVLGGGKNMKNIYSQLSSMLERYMIENDVFIDYLLIDYFIDIIFQDDVTFRKTIEQEQYSQPDLHYLRLNFNKSFDKNEWLKILLHNNIFKLTYKGSYIEYTKDGQQTYYGHILQTTPQ